MRRLLVLLMLMSTVFMTSPASAQNGRLQIVVSFSILRDMVTIIATGFIEPDDHIQTLIPDGVDPHSYEPSARDIANISSADIIFIAGGGFEGEALLDAIRSAAPDTPIIEASACVPMRPYGEPVGEAHLEDHTQPHLDAVGIDLSQFCQMHHGYIESWVDRKGISPLPSYDGAVGRLYTGACDGSEEAHHAHEGHDHGPCDPHVWSDPHNMYFWASYVTEVLSKIDPGRADRYSGNGTDYTAFLTSAIRENETLLEAIPPDRRVLMTNHDTLGYFAVAYGFKQAGFVLPGGSTLAEPSARDLAALIDLIRTEDIPAIFVESTLSARVAEQIAAETGVEIYRLYTDSLSGPDGPASTYFDYIAYNFSTIAAALTPQ